MKYMFREKTVELIKASSECDDTVEKLRVAAYCRVSTDSEDQINSFIAQVRYYNEYIRGQEDMVLMDIYADEGISGTSRNKRNEFNRMMRDCKAGKVDRILVKSVSRFARNSLECIEAVRELKRYGTTVLFENDGIDSKQMNHELVLYIKGAFAQDEAMSTSKRVRRSNQMRMENGQYGFVSAPFGYRLVGGTLEPVEEEVGVVRMIYDYYLSGMGFGKIAMELNSQDVPGKPWAMGTVRYILTNEKYIGDSIYQKHYTTDTLPFKRKLNYGELEKYYVSNTHEAILDKDTFNAVQEMIKANLQGKSEKAESKKHRFSGIIYCGDCNRAYKRHIQNGIAYWVCSKNGVAGQRCNTHPLSEEVIERTFCYFYNKLRQHMGELLKSTLNRLIELKSVITNSKSQITEIDNEILELSDKISFFTGLLSRNSIDRDIFNNTVTPAKTRIADLRDRRKRLLSDDEDEKCIDELRQLISFLNASPDVILKYDHELFKGIIKRVVVTEQTLAFELKSGIVIEQVILWN